MSDQVITVDNLSKLYRIGLREEVPETLAQAAWQWAKAPLRRIRSIQSLNTYGANGSASDVIWALRDVSFTVKRGDVVGIIGRNGSGKSTLLKILSRITEPTSGRALMRGRLSSLLEVGTGFHSELTGRENVYMNGTILGMKKREIDRKFDEIVEFSGVEKFLDTPIKRYSSGMTVRLAFSVAAHLEPEILVIDEVLAVGDVDFQRKCIGKLESVAQGGRTVLFVSHNMAILQSLCKFGIVLSNGRITCRDNIVDAIAFYLRSFETLASRGIANRTDRIGRGEIHVQGLSVAAGSDMPMNTLVTGAPAEFLFELNDMKHNVHVSFTIHDQRGMAISTLSTRRASPHDQRKSGRGNTMVCRVPELPLMAGRYYISFNVIRNRDMQDAVDGALFFDVQNGDYRGRVIPEPREIPGCVAVEHIWLTPW